MNSETLQALLTALNTGDAAAAATYQGLHTRLERFFELQDAADPAALADTVLDRLAAALTAREPRGIQSPAAFALGIARHVLQEERRRALRDQQTAREWMASRAGKDASHDEARMAALDRCLERMPQERRDLLSAYYGWSDGDKVRYHRALAERFNLSLNALRNRLLRARTDLLSCLKRSPRDVSGQNDRAMQQNRVPKGGS